MLNRSSIFALATVAAVAAAALAPTSASARGFGGGFDGGHSFGGGGFARTASIGGGRSFGGGLAHTTSFARVNRGPIGGGFRRTFGGRNWARGNSPGITRVSGCYFHYCGPVTTPGTPPGHGNCLIDCGNPGVPPCLIDCGGHLPPPIVWWWKHHHHPHWGVVDYETPAVVDAPVDGAVATAATPAPCNCLTKQYLDDGSVLFQDICTKEAALATPDELKAQANGAAPTQATAQ
jgi:hypothetical protein